MLDESVIRAIASWGDGGVTTSVYLDVDGLRHPRWPDVEQRADQLFRAARRRPQLEVTGTRDGLEADLADISSWLGHDLDRTSTRGVALFSRAANGLFEAVQLPVPVRDQVVVDRDPDIAQLCMVLATSWSAMAVVVNAQKWRVVRLELDGGAQELDVLDDLAPRNVDIDIELAGFGRHREELAREHYRHVARAVTAEQTHRPVEYVVLCGPPESLAELERYLPERIVARIAGRVAVPMEMERSELARAVREAVDLAEEQRRSTVVATLRDRAATDTLVATGLDATLDALGAGQVTTLVVERTFEAPGGRCDDCRLLVTQVESCPRCGGNVRPNENVVDAAIADAFLHGVALEPVEDGVLGDLGRIGGLIASWSAPSEGPGNA